MSRPKRMEAYLASVPGGLGGHAACRSKIGPLQLAFELKPCELEGLVPPALERHLGGEHLMSDWIPTVHYYALFLAQADVLGFSDDEMRAAWRALSVEMSSSRLYHFLFSLLSPSTVARAAARSWGFFHRGFSLAHEPADADDDFFLVLRHPEHLVDDQLCHALQGTYEGFISMARFAVEEVVLSSRESTCARFLARHALP